MIIGAVGGIFLFALLLAPVWYLAYVHVLGLDTSNAFQWANMQNKIVESTHLYLRFRFFVVSYY